MIKPVKQTIAALVFSMSIAGFAIPAHAAQAPKTAGANSYIAQTNDTFWSISRKLLIPLNLLLEANTNIDPMNVYQGLAIKLPPANKFTATSLIPSNNSKKTEVKAASVEEAPAVIPAAAAAPQEATPKAAPKAVTKAAPTAQPAAKAAEKSKPAAGNAVKTASGEVKSYSKMLDIVATGYSSAADENGGWGAVDYFGNPLKLGTIAVDPNVIPLGTKVYITGISHSGLPSSLVATASDMGGAIKGNRIDIFIPGSKNVVSSFGMQNVKVYVLK